MTNRQMLATFFGILATLLLGAWIKDGMPLPQFGAPAVAERPADAPPPCLAYDSEGKRAGTCEPKASTGPCFKYDLTGRRIGPC